MNNIASKAFLTAVPVRRTCAGRRATLAFSVTLGVLITSTAWAQLAVPGAAPGTGAIATGSRVRGAPEKAPLAAPDAVPGAKAREPVAPATQPAGDLQPTEALFDAINRGDIVAARDALSRGADLNGINVLGMTPMELSVDLGRNDISFLLLSMRGEDGGRGSRAVGHGNAAPEPHVKTAQAAKPAARRVGRAVTVAPVASKAAAAPKLFANDGGTPLPSAGFLGFDSRSASN